MADVLCPSVPVWRDDLICIPYFPSVPRETPPWGGHLKSTVYESNPHTIQELKDNISHTVAAIKTTMFHQIYLNMVTARLLTKCSNTLHNIHTNAGENITTCAKRKAG